jgi:hypothetical protein
MEGQQTVKYKVLMHHGVFVDTNMLFEGIYESSQPTLFTVEDTIEELVDSYSNMKRHFDECEFADYISNLKKCVLVEATLLISVPTFEALSSPEVPSQ